MRSALGGSLDQMLTGLALRAGPAGRRLSWRLGLAAQRQVQRVHEAVLRGWKARDRFWIDPALAEAAWVTRPDEAPGHPCPAWSSDHISRRAKELLDGVCPLEDGRVAPVQHVPWFGWAPGAGPAGGSFRLQALNGAAELLQAHALSGDRRYQERAIELARSWIASCLARERPDIIWDDHATALRAVVLCQVWHGLGSQGGASQVGRELLTALVRHAARLALPAFYRAHHNHGVSQAYAQLAIGLGIPGLPGAHDCVRLGIARLEAQMRDNVSPEGLHREHSPFYHFFVFRQFLEARALAHRHGLELSAAFEERLRAMLASATCLLKPDGLLPALGDTARTSPTMVDHLVAAWTGPEAEHYRWARTRGREGQPRPSSAGLFPQAGYASVRSGRGERPEDERHMVVRVATLQTAHIHRDLLSFELYGYGDDLVVDSGGPYAYGHPLRAQYFLATRAHNTVVVDDRSQHVRAARILAWTPEPPCAGLVAEHRAYADVTHRRSLALVLGRYVLVLDRLDASRPHVYSQLFHLNPALEVVTRDLAVATAHRGGGPTLRILPLLPDGLALRLHHGTQHPHQGWVCTGVRRMEPAHVVDYQRAGTAACFAALLVPEPAGRPEAVRAELEGVPFDGPATLRIAAGAERVEIAISPEGHVTLVGSPDAR